MYLRTATLLTAALSLFSTASAKSAVLDLLPSNFDEVVLNSGKPALVEFFAPWCGHCKTLAPIYEELGAAFEHAKGKVSIAKVDADEHRELGTRFGVSGFPTLKWFDGKSAKPIDYSSGRDLDSLKKFVEEKTGLKGRGKKTAPSDVEILTDSTFSSVVGKDKDVLVAFTAPWCGHCKSLAPVWEELATTFAADKSSVSIAKVDADAPTGKATAGKYGVTSYPTIKFFPAGSTEAVDYTSGRSEAALVSFINEKAGTHRVPGGGLDATAGTIAALDTLVAKFTGKQSTLAEVGEELKAAAADLKDSTAAYYVKVADKLAANAGYLDKEITRLGGILKKGGLAPAKADELTKRSNILQRFKEKVVGKDEL